MGYVGYNFLIWVKSMEILVWYARIILMDMCEDNLKTCINIYLIVLNAFK